MSDMTVAFGVPEVNEGQTVPASTGAPATFSGAWSDFGKDMAAIEAEMGQKAEPAQPVQPQAVATPSPAPIEPAPSDKAVPPVAVAPVAPAAPAPVAAPVESVPDKFKAPDGTLDQDKVMKSYFEAEKELKRLQNAKSVPAQTAQTPAPVVPVATAPANLTPFEAQVAQDIFSQGGFTEQQAIALARVQVKLQEAAHQATAAATLSEVAQFRETLAQQQQRSELEALAKNPQTNWVLSPKGQEELVKARQENPHLNHSPEPWKAAALHVLGQRMLQGQAGSVVVPIPQGGQKTGIAPLPVTPTPPAANPIQLNTPAQIEAYLKTLSADQEAQFWKSQGMKWDAPKQFKGY